ncbi:MAG: hypothetical protein Q4B43_07470 [Bacteroidota bacterium]|nr:hypothetical protein [Bacteroidota bacterium]
MPCKGLNQIADTSHDNQRNGIAVETVYFHGNDSKKQRDHQKSQPQTDNQGNELRQLLQIVRRVYHRKPTKGEKPHRAIAFPNLQILKNNAFHQRIGNHQEHRK